MAKRQLILNTTRNLGDIISDGFVFVKRNYKVVGELFLILVLPILLVGIYNVYYIFQGVDFLEPNVASPFEAVGGLKVILGYGFTVVGILIFYFINYSTAICYVRNENESPSRSQVIDFMKANAVKYLTYFFALIAFFIAVMGVTAATVFISPVLTGLFVFILFIGIFFLFPYFSVLPLAYMDTGKSIVDALKDTFRLIKGQWWPTFGTIMITNIIGSFASYILIIPVYAIMMVQVFSSIDDGGSGDSMGFWMSILMIVSIIASTIILVYTSAAVALKYYDLRERTDNTSLVDKIDAIGNSDSGIFENEGEF